MSNTGATFAGSMPGFYERYMVPMHFAEHARVMVTRLGTMRSSQILEIAAGTGAVTRILDRDLPETVHITATDLNEPMLDQARARIGTGRVRWRREDALSLSFPPSTFDVVLCQFGVMFFPDKPRAFREVCRVLKPGGRFIFSLWDRLERNPLPEITERTVAALFPVDAPRSNQVPFSYHDPDLVRADLASAGLVASEVEVVVGHSRAPCAHTMATAYVQGGVLRHEIEAHGPGWLERATQVVSDALVATFGDGPVAVPNQALLVTAHKPRS